MLLSNIINIERSVKSVIGCGSKFFNYFMVERNCENSLLFLLFLLVEWVFELFGIKVFFCCFYFIFIDLLVGCFVVLY